MTGFHSLPNELIVMIADCLHDDKVSMSKLSRTSHAIRELVLPSLTRSVTISNRNDESYQGLLRRFPKLAAAVKSLTLHYHDPQSFTDYLDNLTMVRKLVIKGAYCSRALHTTFEDHFTEVLEEGAMSQLQELEVNLTDGQEWYCDLDVFMAHTGLKRLTILHARVECETIELADRSSNLEELTFLCCDIALKQLRLVLAKPKGLRRFTMKGDVRPLSGHLLSRHVQRHPPQTYLDALIPHKHTLKALDLNFLANVGWSNSEPLDLRHLSQLEQFTVRLDELYSTVLYETPLEECRLPDSLKEMKVWTLHEARAQGYQKAIRRDLNHWIHALPNLRSFAFVSPRRVTFDDEHPALHQQVDVRWERFTNGGYWLDDCEECRYRMNWWFRDDPESESESDSEAESEAESEPESEAESEAEPDSNSGSSSDPDYSPDSDSDSDSTSGFDSDIE
ncbi:uncharacterized protein DSM5745_00071 [Aspergillus mulundensis]|uniref:F-box domain-containing protein n=1 Tax=Aspergillus mulundensis TaxID=1810919 RepID=A0A3D8T2K8_9EURO|nr:hypothetical protein DSM5745_00071 [Aspergillus mulundensis]RDW92749.1 hypothetical protein DSM5745_00071 [Aspergillus mulundensis]